MSHLLIKSCGSSEFGEAHEKLATHAQCVYLLDEFVDFRVQLTDFHQRLIRAKKAFHLIAYRIIYFDADVVDGRSLGVIRLNTRNLHYMILKKKVDHFIRIDKNYFDSCD